MSQTLTLQSQEVELLDLNLNLPNHENELSNAEHYMNKLRVKFAKAVEDNDFDDETHNQLYDEAMRCLLHVGELSQFLFDVDEKIEMEYFKAYKHVPALAKDLWQEHNHTIHRPYNILKNRCYRFLDELDEVYIGLYNSEPLNYNCNHLNDLIN